MREIKFRGQRVDNKEWVYGDGIHYPKSINYMGTCWIDGMGKVANDWVQVIPETVGQFTGSQDTNGVDIYEGDVITAHKYPFFVFNNANYNAVVIWSNDLLAYRYEYYKISDRVRGECHGNCEDLCELDDEAVIIGNTHENPELLEVTP